MEETEKSKSKRGGRREGSGRKKTTAKSYAFRAPDDVMAILEKVEGKMTDFICEAIREKARNER